MDGFAALGFKPCDTISNQYGIIVYIGTTQYEANDWGCHIPYYLCKKKIGKEKADKYCKNGVTYYAETKDMIYKTVKEWTKFAEQHFENLK